MARKKTKVVRKQQTPPTWDYISQLELAFGFEFPPLLAHYYVENNRDMFWPCSTGSIFPIGGVTFTLNGVFPLKRDERFYLPTVESVMADRPNYVPESFIPFAAATRAVKDEVLYWEVGTWKVYYDHAGRLIPICESVDLFFELLSTASYNGRIAYQIMPDGRIKPFHKSEPLSPGAFHVNCSYYDHYEMDRDGNWRSQRDSGRFPPGWRLRGREEGVERHWSQLNASEAAHLDAVDDRLATITALQAQGLPTKKIILAIQRRDSQYNHSRYYADLRTMKMRSDAEIDSLDAPTLRCGEYLVFAEI